MHDTLPLRISAILPEAISDGGLTPTTDTDLLLDTYKGGSHLTSDIHSHKMYVLLFYISQTLREEFFHLSKYNVHQFRSCLDARPCNVRRD